jgi:hypothetical protein
MDSRARQVGFMSTQKRENGTTPATTTCRRGPRYRWQRMGCTERTGAWKSPHPAQFARYVCAVAIGQTAPLLLVLRLAITWLATKFLQSDHLIRPLVRPVFKADRRGSPPLRAVRRTALDTQASPRSSLPHIPFPTGFAGLHRTLPQDPGRPQGLVGPQAPAGYHRRAERYDGKRDMYFQHAARNAAGNS